MQTNSGKKLYSIPETYGIMVNAFRSSRYLRRARKAGKMNKNFMERIMLAVTEVNGCAMCSYYHTRVALESGMTSEEIKGMLCGDCGDAPEEELQAILFAQHYADTRGKPSKEAWDPIVKTYGEDGAYGVLAAIRMIMMGNVMGIAWGSFFNRFRGKPDKRSSLPYELGIMLCTILFIPAGLIHAGLAVLFKAPIIRF